MTVRSEAAYWRAVAEHAELAALPDRSEAVLDVVRAFRRDRLEQAAAEAWGRLPGCPWHGAR